MDPTKPFLLLLLLLTLSYQSFTITAGRQETSSIIRRLLELINELYGVHEPILVFPLEPAHNLAESSIDQDFLFKELSKVSKWTLNVFSEAPAAHFYYNQSVMVFQDIRELARIFASLHINHSLNPHAFYLIALTRTLTRDSLSATVEEVFRHLFTYDILNAVLLIANTTVELYVSRPFQDGSCQFNVRNDVVRINLTNHWNGFQMVTKKFRRCTINVVYLDIPPYVKVNKTTGGVSGVEPSILREIFGPLNVSLNFTEHDDLGGVNDADVPIGALKVLANKVADIAIGGYRQTSNRLKNLDGSTAYSTESLAWVVPRENIARSPLLGPVNVISGTVWMSNLIFGIVTGSLILYMARRNGTREEEFYRHFSGILQAFMLSFMASTIQQLPKTWPVRCILGIVLFYCIIFSAAYTTYLTSVLTRGEPFRDKYQTFQDVVKYSLPIFYAPNAEKFFDKNDTKFGPSYSKLFKYCPVPDYEHCVRQVGYYKNASFLAQLSFIRRAAEKYNNSLRILPELIVSYYLNFLMYKGFWGTQYVSRQVSLALNHGLIEKWIRLSENKSIVRLEKTNKRLLTLANMWFAVQIAGVGWTVAAIAFLLELLIYKFKKQDQRLLEIYK